MKNSFPKSALFTTILSLSSICTMVAEAQELEEIVVTAQKVTARLLDTPISIAVASSDDINTLNMQDFTETAKLTPGIALQPGIQAASIRMRGVGPAFFSLSFPQSVAVFVDQVPQSQVGAVFATLVDVAQLEVLRGPQATLYGENAPGGVYNITTPKPGTDLVEGYLRGSNSMFDSSDMATTDIRGAINLPLIEDKLGWRIAGVYADSDGFVEMANPEAAASTLGGKKHHSLRSRLLWNVSDSVEVLWTVNYQDLTDYQAGLNYDGIVPGSGGSNPVPAVLNTFEDRKTYDTREGILKAEVKDTSIHVSWDAEFSQIDFIGAYQEFESDNFEPRNNFFGGNDFFTLIPDYDITSFELRFSDSGDVIDYVAGLWYTDRGSNSTSGVFFPPAFIINTSTVIDRLTQSAYGNVTWHLTEQWDISGGLRYDDYESDVYSQLDLNGNVMAPRSESTGDGYVSWSAKLRYYANDELTTYIAADHGFKQGGINANLRDFVAFPGPLGEAARSNLIVKDETSTALEIGVKGTMLDQSLQYGGAIFYQQFDDHQVVHTAPSGSGLDALFIFTQTNAEEALTQGIEFDVTWQLTENWRFANRLAYFEATAEDWSNHFCSTAEFQETGEIFCPQNDQPLNDLPQWNMNNRVFYDRGLGNGWNLYSNVSWTWQSGPNFTENTDKFDEDKSLIDASIGLYSAELGLDFRFWGKNLTDEDLNLNPNLLPNGDPALPDAFEGGFFRGLEYGVTVNYSF